MILLFFLLLLLRSDVFQVLAAISDSEWNGFASAMNAILEFFLPFGRYRFFSPRFFCSVLFFFFCEEFCLVYACRLRTFLTVSFINCCYLQTSYHRVVLLAVIAGLDAVLPGLPVDFVSNCIKFHWILFGHRFSSSMVPDFTEFLRGVTVFSWLLSSCNQVWL